MSPQRFNQPRRVANRARSWFPLLRLLSLLFLSALTLQCATSVEEGELEGDGKGRRDCSQRWIPSGPRVSTQEIPYEGAVRCLGRAQPGAQEIGALLRELFSPLIDLTVEGDGVQIYSCRSVRGGSSTSLHSEGRAIDLFIPVAAGWTADNARGDRIADWLIDNATQLGIQYLIWDRSVWRASGGQPRHRCYRGESPHVDHIHIEISWAAARRETAFFRGGRESLSPTPSLLVPTQWIGEPCEDDAVCLSAGGAQGECLSGWCTLPCEGYCPDRPGAPLSFCVPGATLGVAGGRCFPRASGACAQGTRPLLSERYLGVSGAPATEAEVCLPGDLLDVPPPSAEDAGLPALTDAGAPPRPALDAAPPPRMDAVAPPQRWWDQSPPPAPMPDRSVAPPPEEDRSPPAPPPSQNGDLCADPALPLSDHDRPCPGFSENFWRCACSERFEEVVSQVCRNGRWINYELSPSDCSRCDGDEQSGCAP